MVAEKPVVANPGARRADMFKRKIFFHLNEHQKGLLYPVLLSCLMGCIVLLLFLDYFYFDQSSIIHDFTFSHLKTLVVWFFPIGGIFLLLVAFLIVYISNKLVGPYERIVRELDDILSGKGRKMLVVRQGDKMFAELIKRINGLIQRLP
jgi:hypothetical protein